MIIRYSGVYAVQYIRIRVVIDIHFLDEVILRDLYNKQQQTNGH